MEVPHFPTEEVSHLNGVAPCPFPYTALAFSDMHFYIHGNCRTIFPTEEVLRTFSNRGSISPEWGRIVHFPVHSPSLSSHALYHHSDCHTAGEAVGVENDVWMEATLRPGKVLDWPLSTADALKKSKEL